MTPTTKEHLTIAILLVSAFLMLALICFSMTGCATAPAKPTADAYVGQAAEISTRIEDKAVVVEQYLKHSR